MDLFERDCVAGMALLAFEDSGISAIVSGLARADVPLAQLLQLLVIHVSRLKWNAMMESRRSASEPVSDEKMRSCR
jgi:hypothetical protein